MFADIERSTVNMLRSRWSSASDSIAEFDINRDFSDVVATPAISAVIETVGMRVPVPGVITIEPVLSLYQVFKNVGDCAARRKGVYGVVSAVVKLISFNDLGLDIDPMEPLGSKEVYHEKLKELGCVCFKTDFKTSFDDVNIDEGDATRLLSESLRYYRDSEEAASDLFALED